MPTSLRAVLFVAVTLLLAAPASAATPSSGTVSLASPSATWTGNAPGYAVVVVNSLGARTCQAPACDEFTLEVAEAGDLTISVTANGASGFTQVEVERPDGSFITNDGAGGEPTSELRIKRAAAGAYVVRTHVNTTVLNDASYRAFAALAPSATGPGERPPLPEGIGEGSARDATVVAVIDSSFNPYHWDFLASRMPQATNDDPGDDLPLDRPASEWLPGAGSLSLERFDITLEESDAGTTMDALREEDSARWDQFPQSSADDVRLTWFPHTKFIAAATFGDRRFIGPNDAHGAGTTSAAVGNLHGTCPECLLVAIQYSGHEAGEAAIEWAMKQPWIDVISNSYGFSTISDIEVVQPRDNIYSGSDRDAQKTAIDRGQTVVFSAGNGHGNAFVFPNSTMFSSQKGPDWMITVGAVSPPENGYYPSFTDEFLGVDVTEEKAGGFFGAGKPVDVASLGIDYPTSYFADTVGETGSIGFSGTSNAAPVTTGIYARSLYTARTRLTGTSRTQHDGVIATGDPIACGDEHSECELGDGQLTGQELRTRLLHGAVPTGEGLTIAGQLVNPTLPKIGEEALLAEGHGVYLGRVTGGATDWLEEQRRITGPLTGDVAPLTRPAGEREWMVVDSYCRQRNWGAWDGGYYREGTTTLPGTDPAWPVRSALERTCPGGPL